METSLRKFITLQTIQAAAVILYIFLTKSEIEQAVFFGLSKSKIALLNAAFAVFILTLMAWLDSGKPGGFLHKSLTKIEMWAIQRKQLIPIILGLTAIASFIALFSAKILFTPLDYSMYSLWAPDSFPTIQAITRNLAAFIALIIAFLLEFAGFLLVRYKSFIRERDYWDLATISPMIIGLVIIIASFGHWLILFLQLKWLVSIAAWYWAVIIKPWSLMDVFYISIILFLMGFAAFLSLKKKKILLTLCIIFVTGWVMQLGTGFLEGEGINSFKDRYFGTYHAVYPKLASANNQSMIETIRDYDETFTNLFTRTKPPGLMTIYTALERVINGNPASTGFSNEIRYERLSYAIMFTFPMVGMAIVFFLYAFSRKFVTFATDWQYLLPSTLIIFTPNNILFSLYADQVIYPALFLSGTWLIYLGFQKRSYLAAFGLGILLYIYAFFAFTMLPLFILASVFLVLLWWLAPDQHPLFNQVIKGLVFLLGVVLAYFLFRGVLNYDFFTRFHETTAINHGNDFYLRVGHAVPLEKETLGTRLNQVIKAMWVNNLEFATTVGVGIYFLFLIYGVKLTIRTLQRRLKPEDIYLASLFFSFIILNLTGSTQGEVGRLWLFWVPMVAIFAGKEIVERFKNPVLITAGLIAIQLITILLTFHYQDLIMSIS